MKKVCLVSTCACDAFFFLLCVCLVLSQEDIEPLPSSNYLDVLLFLHAEVHLCFYSFAVSNVFAVNWCDTELLQSRSQCYTWPCFVQCTFVYEALAATRDLCHSVVIQVLYEQNVPFLQCLIWQGTFLPLLA